MRPIRLAAALAALSVTAGVAGCRPTAPAKRAQVRVAAAADLNVVLPELAMRFSAARAIDLSVTYGSSGNFYSQLLNGAPFDLFLSADVSYPRELAARGLVADEGQFTYAIGRLAAWVPAGSPLDLQSAGLRALADPRVKHVAIANPAHAPYGRAAVAALRGAGVYDQVASKIAYAENVAQALQFVQSGAADAGLVALALVRSPRAASGRFVEVPSDLYPPIEQGGAILKATPDAAPARAFAAYLTGGEGRTMLVSHGFAVP